jgi:hypoxanthine-DNA glycosylase
MDTIRNRTIRPSSRQETSKSYKINTEKVLSGDTLIVNIDHETKSFKKTYRFKGADVAHKDSISFRVADFGTHIDISWSGAQPIGTTTASSSTPKQEIKTPTPKPVVKTITTSHSKKSFEPLVADDTEILILGTIPGDRSLELREYYAHSRNRFWKIIAAITDNEIPTTYDEKISLLVNYKIGLWDVAKAADRKGSLDKDIFNAVTNDIDGLLRKYKKIKVIGFNGSKAVELFAINFSRQQNISYLNLRSTSPANTTITFEQICNDWKRIFK